MNKKTMILPFKLSFFNIFKSKFIWFFLPLIFLIFLADDLFFSFKLVDKSIDFSNNFYYVVQIVIYSLAIIIFFTYLTLKLMIYDIKDNKHKIELRFGYSTKNIYFSRLVLIFLFALFICLAQLVLAIIFYFANSWPSDLFAYKFYIIPIGWNLLFAIMTIFVSLFFTLFLKERIGSIISPVFLIIILVFSVIFPMIYQAPVYGEIIDMQGTHTGIIYKDQDYLLDGLYGNYFQKINNLDLSNYKENGSNESLQQVIDNTLDSIYSNPDDSQQRQDFISQMVENDSNFEFNSIIDNAVKNSNPPLISPTDVNGQDKAITFSKNLVVNLQKSNQKNDKVVNFCISLLSRIKILNYINNKDAGFIDWDYAYNDQGDNIQQQWINFVKTQFYNMYYQGFSKDSSDQFINSDKHVIYEQNFNKTKKESVISYFLNPFIQINSMIYGTNYVDNFAAQLLDSNAEFGTMPNFNFNLQVDNSHPGSTRYLVNKIKPIISTNLIYIIYVIFMIGACCLLSLKFAKLIRP